MTPSVNEQAVAVFTALLGAWNRRDAAAFAAHFAPDGHVTGFDGSQMNGPADIATELGAIFAHHHGNYFPTGDVQFGGHFKRQSPSLS